jgi:hypothetical protein
MSADSGNGHNLNFTIEYLNIKPAAGDKVHYSGHHLICMPAVIAYAANTQGSQLPEVFIVHLGNSDIEFIFNSCDYRPQYLPFTFK